MNMEEYLNPTFFINSDNPLIIEYAENIILGIEGDVKKAVALYYAVRDDIFYDPYSISYEKESMKASYTLKAKRGYCVAKAVLLAALLRHSKIPARLGFADVTNHLNTENLKKSMGTDIFYYHGFTDILLNGKWVKATPAFNLSLCEKFGVKPLEFDGTEDSIFHPFDQKGRRHMEYINDHGTFSDLPFDKIHESYRIHYPLIYEKEKEKDRMYRGDFEKEAEAQKLKET